MSLSGWVSDRLYSHLFAPSNQSLKVIKKFGQSLVYQYKAVPSTRLGLSLVEASGRRLKDGVSTQWSDEMTHCNEVTLPTPEAAVQVGSLAGVGLKPTADKC